MLELVLSCRHKDTDTRLSSFALGGGNRYTHVYKIWIVTSLLLSPKERGAWLERWGVWGHTQSTCTVDIFTYFYVACRNFTAFGRFALENSAKHCKRHASPLTHPLFSFPQGSSFTCALHVWPCIASSPPYHYAFLGGGRGFLSGRLSITTAHRCCQSKYEDKIPASH